MKLSTLVVLLLLPQVLPGGDAAKEGRRGNTLYESDLYSEAATAYRAGLATYDADDRPDAVYYGLQNNLGAALYRQQDWTAAAEAFVGARDAALTPADHARAAYNAGNTAFQQQEFEAALDHYRDALLADPSNQDAKFNYELVKRRTREEDQQQQEGDDQNENQDDQNEEQQNQDPQQNGEQDEQQEEQQQDGQQDGQQDQQQQEQQEPQQEEPQQQPPPDPQEALSREQAERILQALEIEEEQLLREVQKIKGRPRRVQKDW